jgi:hypothetical protein
VLTSRNQRRGLPQCVEYRAAKEVWSLVFSLSFFRREEDDKKAMTDCARGRKGAQGQLFVLIASRCHNHGGEAMDPCRMLYMLTRLPNSSRIMPSTVQDMAIVSKTGPKIVVGLLEVMVLRQNLPARSASPKANRAMDKVTQRVAIS